MNKNFGFGCMRLPMIGEEVDLKEFSMMIESFFTAGFNYFDTAHGYIEGKSEQAIKECLTSKYPRDAYELTNKLTIPYFNKEEDIRPFFEKQLEWCGVEYFDYYLMHAQSAEIFEHFKKHKAYETAIALKEEGKIKHFGISFHDKAFVLDQILTEYPEVEIVQIQFNYADYEDVSVESRLCYEVCRKHGKPVIVMEPLKGGSILQLPKEAEVLIQELGSKEILEYALRFAASFEGIAMVLSGMSSLEQMKQNAEIMKDFIPLNKIEFETITKVREIFMAQNLIPCTNCRYCVEQCPKKILIPNLFACMNERNQYQNWNTSYYYNEVHTKHGGKASTCVKCGKCEGICPQHLEIRKLLVDVAKEFE